MSLADQYHEMDIVSKLRSEQEQRNRDRHLDDIREILKTPQGRRLLWNILSSCAVMSASMSLEPLNMAYREGQRSIGLTMMQDIMEAQPEAYDRMRRENYSNAKADEAAINNRLKREGLL